MPSRVDPFPRPGARPSRSVLWMVVLGGLGGVLTLIGLEFRAIETLDARARIQHARMLEDTQSLADESGSLVEEIAALRRELAALRTEVAALRHARR